MAKSQNQKKKAQVKKSQEVLGVSSKKRKGRVKNKTQQQPVSYAVMVMGPTGKKRMQK